MQVSDNSGELNSWERKFESESELFLSYDSTQSGLVYIATDKEIYESNNYGETFQLYKELDKSIKGIYKKPNSDLMYVTTSHSLLEINSDSTRVLKQLINYDALSYYPLHVGDKWCYDVKRIGVWEPTETTYSYIREVVKDTTMVNNRKYFQIRESRSDTNIIQYSYERIDSLNAKIFKYDQPFNNGKEFIIEDLILEQDNFFFAWKDYGGEYYEGNIFLINISFQPVFENQTLIKESKFYQSEQAGTIHGTSYYLTKSIGKVYQHIGLLDAFDDAYKLEAAYINGKKYGDTTLVGVKRIVETLPIKTSLSQNYPNPFNPATTIKYIIPNPTHPLIPSREGKERSERGVLQNSLPAFGVGVVTLKVYDILGKEVATLVNKQQNPGSYEVTFDASKLSSGVYYYQLKSGKFIETKKMIVLK